MCETSHQSSLLIGPPLLLLANICCSELSYFLKGRDRTWCEEAVPSRWPPVLLPCSFSSIRLKLFFTSHFEHFAILRRAVRYGRSSHSDRPPSPSGLPTWRLSGLSSCVLHREPVVLPAVGCCHVLRPPVVPNTVHHASHSSAVGTEQRTDWLERKTDGGD